MSKKIVFNIFGVKPILSLTYISFIQKVKITLQIKMTKSRFSSYQG
jgi:hypothetical protein